MPGGGSHASGAHCTELTILYAVDSTICDVMAIVNFLENILELRRDLYYKVNVTLYLH